MRFENWDQVHPVSIDLPWDVSTTWLESTCGKFNWLDMIWKGTHVYIRSHSWQCVSEQNQAMRLKELSVDLGKGTKKCLQHWRSPRIHWPPFLNGKSLEPPRHFLDKLGCQQSREKGLGQGGDCLVWQLLGLRPQATTEGSAYGPVHHRGQASCHPGPLYQACQRKAPKIVKDSSHPSQDSSLCYRTASTISIQKAS
jgi:hypothetical protein